jgi:integrase
MGLGSYPAVSIAKARIKRDEAHQHLIGGRDPILVQDKAAKIFRQWSEEFFEKRGQKWSDKYKENLKSMLETYAYPWIGSFTIQEIDADKVFEILSPIWYDKTPTASLLRRLIEKIWDFAAVLTKWEGRNPARWQGNLDKLLDPPGKIHTVENYPSVPYEEIPRFYREVRRRKSVWRKTLAVIILLVPRDIMILPARRKEFDLEKKVWTIPGARVKGIRDDFRVPLPDPVIAILDELNIRDLRPEDFVFRGRKAGRPIRGDSVLQCLHTVDARYTVHGCRSSFRTWGYEYEKKDFRQDIVETALAHLTKAAKASGATSLEVWRAYQRGDALEKRRHLMDAWAAFVIGAQETGKAVAATEPTVFTPSSSYGQIKVTLALQSAVNLFIGGSLVTERIEAIGLTETPVLSASLKELAVRQNIVEAVGKSWHRQGQAGRCQGRGGAASSPAGQPGGNPPGPRQLPAPRFPAGLRDAATRC